MKLWVDDIREPPTNYIWCKSVNQAIMQIRLAGYAQDNIEVIDIDHDAGDYAYDGGDYIMEI